MAGLTAAQIIERIASANGIEPVAMRQQMEQVLQKILQDTTRPHAAMLSNMFPGGEPTVDELVIALEYELYETMMPSFPDWEWDGDAYRNVSLRQNETG